MAALKITCLGGLTISQDGLALVEIKSRKGQALFCYLAVTSKPYSRSTLVGLLWPEMPEAKARTNLRKVLSRIKPWLGPYLLISRETVAFNRKLGWL